MPGRKPKPTRLKVLEGNPGKRPILAALRHRRRTGEGQEIEVAQTEPTIAVLGAAMTACGRADWKPVLKATVGRVAPQGVFPVAGEDRWIAIAVTDDAAWTGFTDVLGEFGDGLETNAARMARLAAGRDRACIGEWEGEALMAALQAKGVAAGLVRTAAGIVDDDPQLKHRGYWPPTSRIDPFCSAGLNLRVRSWGSRMKIAVLGAGVVGAMCAHELLRDGHEVVLVDKEHDASLGTSYGNAGFVSPGHAYAWASPKAPGVLLRSLWRNDQALRFKPSLDPALWRWMAKFLGQCTAEKAAWNTARKVSLCVYSKDRLNLIAQETGFEFDHLRKGCIYLFRSQAGLEAGAKKARILIDQGVKVETVDMDRAARLDPALEGVKDQFAGALFTPGDETGDCRTFVQRLAAHLGERGADLRFGTTVQRIEAQGDRATRVVTDKGPIEADAFVLSLGTASPKFGRVAGLDLPIYPVKGYSMTAPVAGRNNPPTLGGIDEENLIAWARYGDRVRVTATAEFAGNATTWTEADFRHMDATIRRIFPDGADWDRAERWAGLRPMTPSGLPIYGRGRLANLWLDTGQGHMGWTMAAGSARITADLIAGRTPELDVSGMIMGELDTRRAA